MAMAMSLSPATLPRYAYQPPITPIKCFIPLQDSHHKVLDCAKYNTVCASGRSASNYASLLLGSGQLSLKPITAKQFHVNRVGVFKCATTEEIEAEKSSIGKSVKEKMEKSLDTVRTNFNSIRSGRANPFILDRIQVECYGAPINLKSIAQISSPDSSSLVVQPYDKSSLKAIEKAIVNSDLDLTPNNDGELIRLSVPQPTSERRKELLKIVSKQTEDGKVALRNIRRDALKAYEKLQKEKKLSEDHVKDLSIDLQKLTDGYTKKIEALYKEKEKELLKV